MQPRKLTVSLATFSYAGNGGTKSETPDVGRWFAKTLLAASRDERIGGFLDEDFCDTPITMTRNRAILEARKNKADVLVMVDSDMSPDMYVGHPDFPEAKPFFSSSFDYLYKHYEKGPVCIGSPYCGPPPDPIKGGFENIYVFHWTNLANAEHGDNFGGLKLDQYTRYEAEREVGIKPVAALPTGLIMWDMRLFDILPQPWFDYEWQGDGPKCPHCHQPKPGARAEKGSTEDVVHTRDMSLVGETLLGYNPILCNWHCWAGHYKPKRVGRPVIYHSDSVNAKLHNAYTRKTNSQDLLLDVPEEGISYDDILPNSGQRYAAFLAAEEKDRVVQAVRNGNGVGRLGQALGRNASVSVSALHANGVPLRQPEAAEA